MVRTEMCQTDLLRKWAPNRRPRSSFTITRIKKLEREAPTEFIPLGKPMPDHRTSRNTTRIKNVPNEGRARQERFIDSLSPCVSPLNPFRRLALKRLENMLREDWTQPSRLASLGHNASLRSVGLNSAVDYSVIV